MLEKTPCPSEVATAGTYSTPWIDRPPSGPALAEGAHKLHKHQPWGQRHAATGSFLSQWNCPGRKGAFTTVLASTSHLDLTLFHGHEPFPRCFGHRWGSGADLAAEAHVGFLLAGPSLHSTCPPAPLSQPGSGGELRPLHPAPALSSALLFNYRLWSNDSLLLAPIIGPHLWHFRHK